MSLSAFRLVYFERGTTLVEALVATALLVTLLGGVAHLFISSQQQALIAERIAAATLVAQDRIQQLSAEPLSWSVHGLPLDAPALAPSPPGTLDADTTGYSEVVDRAGRAAGEEDAEGPAFVRRWAIALARPSDSEALSIEVCVFAWPSPEGAVPVACLHTIRARQP